MKLTQTQLFSCTIFFVVGRVVRNFHRKFFEKAKSPFSQEVWKYEPLQ